MAQVIVHLIDGDRFTIDYEDYGPMLDIPQELWRQHGVSVSESDVELLEPVG